MLTEYDKDIIKNYYITEKDYYSKILVVYPNFFNDARILV